MEGSELGVELGAEGLFCLFISQFMRERAQNIKAINSFIESTTEGAIEARSL